MLRRFPSLAVLLALALSLAGCCSNGSRQVRYVGPPVGSPACERCAARPGLPPRVVPAPVPAGVAVPPPGALIVPPGAVPAQPQGTLAIPPGATAVPAVPAPGQVVQGSYTPPPVTESSPPRQEPTVRLAPPELSTPGPPPSAEPPLATQPPSVTERRDPPKTTPIDVPQFAEARAKVANGLQPFPDGLAWLKENGYRTVLYVRPPGTDDAAARRQVEKYGLRYLSIEAEPRTLTKETVDFFNRLVTDEANLSLFVYDKDASLTGGLWYLHFRIVEGWSDEKARATAARLGFRQEQDDNHRTMWIAVQKLLEANGR